MTMTTFDALTQPEKIVWARDTMRQARNASFIEKWTGKDENSYIQRISEFSKTEKGATARIHLIADLGNEGTMGDSELWDNEEALVDSWQEIAIDQIRNATRLGGKMTDQKMVINFRETSKNNLGYWIANMNDQMAFHHLSGVPTTMALNGTFRIGFKAAGFGGGYTDITTSGCALVDNVFSSNLSTFGHSLFGHSSSLDITAPSSLRGYRWDDSSRTLEVRAAASMTSADVISYETIVQLKALAKEKYIRGVKTAGGEEEYLLIVGPRSMARLRLDPDFLANSRALQTGMGDKSQLATGAGGVLVNGVRVIESRYVFNTQGAAATTGAGDEGDWGFRWGAHGANVHGERCLFLGAQALAYADLGLPSWEEQPWDYNNQNGIAIAKIVGFLKPRFKTIYETGGDSFTPLDGGSAHNVVDFAVMTVDVATGAA